MLLLPITTLASDVHAVPTTFTSDFGEFPHAGWLRDGDWSGTPRHVAMPGDTWPNDSGLQLRGNRLER